MVATVNASGLDDLDRFIARDQSAARRAASITVNAAARRARTEGSRRIQAQVALKPGYVTSNMSVTFATRGELRAAVTGRFRPTSLARFATNRGAKTGTTPKLRVKRNSPSRALRNAFLIRLRAGTSDGVNTGVAVRLKPGEQLRGRRKAVRFSRGDSNLYLLYGPSVDQVFSTVRTDITPDILQFMDREFQRQFTRLSR